MNDVVDIKLLHLCLGYLLLLLPLAVFWYYNTGLIKEILISIVRMTVQLALVGVYIKYLFIWNNLWINLSWVLIMIVAATYSATTRSGLKLSLFFWPIFISMFSIIIIFGVIFLGVIIDFNHLFDARYLIPLMGMILGNTLKSNIIALNVFYTDLSQNLVLYRFSLANGASQQEALRPFIQKALKQAFNPHLATMAVMGLISLPGMMTGQILGGSEPATAVKYQIMIMLAIFIIGVIQVITGIFLANQVALDAYGQPLKNILTEK